MESRPDRGRGLAGIERSGLASLRALHAPGSNRGRARRGIEGGHDGLAADRRVVRRAAESGSVSGDRAQSRGRDRDARWTGGGALAGRCDSRAWRPGGVSPRPCGARRSLPPTRAHERGDHSLPTRVGAGHTRAGAAVHHPAAGGTTRESFRQLVRAIKKPHSSHLDDARGRRRRIISDFELHRVFPGGDE